jgi:hypothetical protein
MTKDKVHPRITLKIGVELEPGCPAVEEVRRELELVAVEALEEARERIMKRLPAKISSWAMRSNVSLPIKPPATPRPAIAAEV